MNWFKNKGHAGQYFLFGYQTIYSNFSLALPSERCIIVTDMGDKPFIERSMKNE